jgi:hypothetical protein
VRRFVLAFVLLGLAAGQAFAAPVARSLLERTTLTVQDPVEWVVVLENAGTTVPEPQFPQLDWARVQATGSSRNFSMVNGNFSSSVSYNFLLVPQNVGRHQIPSVTFEIGRTVVRSEPVTVDVVPAAPGLSSGSSGAGGARLKLVINVDRNHAVVGEPIRMTVRFFQGVRLRSDPDYRAPDIPGFWSEAPAVPRSYYVSDAGGRWLVSETRVFLYPTVSGRLRIGSAKMECELAGDEDDGGASGLSGGGAPGQTIEIQSDPIGVDVTPAPAAGQPGDYQGAVGDFALSLHPERVRVRADETMNLTVRVAGSGNLRLAPIPQWPALDDFQIYSKSTDDSLNFDGDWPAGAKIVTYSLLPRRQGVLRLPALRYVTYVPGQGYRTLTSGELSIQVDPPIAGVTGVRALQPLEVPRGLYLPPRPWPGWLAALLGAGAALLSAARLARRRAQSPEVRAVHAVTHARAALRNAKDAQAFYLEAERVLESEPLEVLREGGDPEEENARRTLLSRARAARYSPAGAAADLVGFQAMLDRHLDALLARVRSRKRGSRVPGLVLALALLTVAGGVAYGVWRSVAGEPGEEAVAVWREAARQIAAGEATPAQDHLSALWSGGVRGGTLAAQTALAALRERKLGEGALWIERGRRESPRDPFVRSVRRVLDEETSLPGHPEGLGTLVTWWELLLVSGSLWLAASGIWAWQIWRGRRASRLGRTVVLVLGGLALVVAVASLGVWTSGFAGRASVVLDPVSLRESPGGNEELDLEPGRLLEVKGARGDWRLVELGGGLRGWVQASALAPVEVPVTPGTVRISQRAR